MRLWLATSNAGKVQELTAMLTPTIQVMAAPTDFAVEEDGDTFAANATKKALALAQQTGEAALADDSGIEVQALGGAPGIHSARYAGVLHGPQQDAANRHKLLQALAEMPWPQRSARFVCVLALAQPGRDVQLFTGQVAGHVSLSEAGDAGFGYDAVFVPDAIPNRTFAQLSAAEKQAISHRGQALQQLLQRLRPSDP